MIKRKYRISFVLAMTIILFTGACLVVSAAAPEYKIKVNQPNPEGSFMGECTRYYFDRVEEFSDGKITVEIYWSGALGDKIASLESLRAHTLEAAEVGVCDLSIFDEGFSVFGLPFLFKDTEDYYMGITNEEVFNFFDERAAEFGLKILAFVTTGYRNPLNTVREVRSPADASNIKIRVFQDKWIARAFDLMGFAPIALGWSEVYTALQQGTVTGAEQSPPLLLDQQLCDFGGYYTKIDAVTMLGMYVMDVEYYNNLPADCQEAIKKARIKSTEWQWGAYKNYEAEATEGMKDKGVKITILTDEKRQVFLDALAGIKEEMFTESPMTKVYYDKIQELTK